MLIVGVAGGQGRLLARRLLRTCEVVGADRQPWTIRLPEVPFYPADTRTRAFEDVLRKERPSAVVHLGFVHHFREPPATRYDINVRGTRRVLDHCLHYGVESVTVLSTSYVYGALPENPQFMDEEQPLSASRNYPEIRDLVEVDALASAFMWRHPELAVSVLRPVPALGPYVETALATYLRTRPVLVAIGFNPMMQAIHEEDLTEALALTVERGLRGVFNVTGPGEVPLRVMVRETGGRALPLPDFALRRLSARIVGLPPGALDYIKYPCTLSGDRFASETGFRPQFGLRDIFRSMRTPRGA